MGGIEMKMKDKPGKSGFKLLNIAMMQGLILKILVIL